MFELEKLFQRVLHAHRHEGNRIHADAARAHEIFQMSTLGALVQGVFDGELTYGELARHGDFGLGTFNALDGEMIAIDGNFYQIKADGSVQAVAPDARTPFAMVTFFRPQIDFVVAGESPKPEVEAQLEGHERTPNLFYSIRLDGFFPHVKARSVKRQTRPYPHLDEAAKSQTVFEFENVGGSLVGFRFPDYSRGFNMPGYHLHFISDDRSRGGHVLDYRGRDLRVRIDATANLHMELPEHGDFMKADLAGDSTDALNKAEK